MTKKEAKKRLKDLKAGIMDVSEEEFRKQIIEAAMLVSFISGWDTRKKVGG